MNPMTDVSNVQAQVPAAPPAHGEIGAHPASGMSANSRLATFWRSFSRFGERRRKLGPATKPCTTLDDPAKRISLDGSDVLGATGLSRRALRQYVSHHGLFGHDSDLDVVEQTTVQTAMGLLARTMNSRADDQSLARKPAPASRLDALRDFANAAVYGRGSVSGAEWAKAEAAGLSRAQRSEVLAVVGLVKETFGLPANTNCDETRLTGGAGKPARQQLRAA